MVPSVDVFKHWITHEGLKIESNIIISLEKLQSSDVNKTLLSRPRPRPFYQDQDPHIFQDQDQGKTLFQNQDQDQDFSRIFVSKSQITHSVST